MDLLLPVREKGQDISNSCLFYKASGSVENQFRNCRLGRERKRLCLVLIMLQLDIGVFSSDGTRWTLG